MTQDVTGGVAPAFRGEGADAAAQRLLKYLPGIYADDEFTGRFLQLFDAFLLPFEQQLDILHLYFDPRTTPADFLPWLATWVDLVLDENWPEPARRTLIQNAADLYRRRGTAGALADTLAIYTGIRPEIIEDGPSGKPFHFRVVFHTSDGGRIDQDRVRRIIDEEKPAHTVYTLEVTA